MKIENLHTKHDEEVFGSFYQNANIQTSNHGIKTFYEFYMKSVLCDIQYPPKSFITYSRNLLPITVGMPGMGEASEEMPACGDA